MSARKADARPLHERTLAQLVSLVVLYGYPFEDLAELIEDRAYDVCEHSGSDCHGTLRQLRRLAAFHEKGSGKGERRARNLADIYLLIGELYLYHDRARKSMRWFRKALRVRESYAAPYHSLALAQSNLGDHAAAARSLEEELIRAPENLYSYLMLAELYERLAEPERFEDALRRLLARDPENVQALHRLVRHYEQEQPGVDVELLRRRLLSVERDMSKAELVIWVYHMCRENRFVEALTALHRMEEKAADSPSIHLLKAAVYGEMRQFTRKKRELALFKRIASGSESVIRGELRQFEEVFGRSAVGKLSRRLAISSPSAGNV